MATTITKGLIGKEDLSIQSSSTETFSRATSTGGSQTMTKVGRHTLNTREYDVMQWGAVGDGTTDDTAALSAILTEISTNGGRIVFPAGYTFCFHVATLNTPLFTLASGNLTFSGYGATLTVKCLTARQPSSGLNEREYGTVFRATGYDNITFEGFTFDGNRNEATGGYIDPRYGLFRANRCNNVTFRKVTVQHFGGGVAPIWGRPNDETVSGGATVDPVRNWTVEGCFFYRCFACVFVGGPQNNTSIINNHFKDGDITTEPGWETTFTYSVGGATAVLPRAIRVDGYSSTTDSVDGTCNQIVVSGNIIDGAAVPIELWNNGNSTGRNPEYAYAAVVSGNTLRGHGGIYLNSWSNSLVTGNAIRHIPSGEMAAYGGKKWNEDGTDGSAATTTPVFVGIECRPGYNNIFSNNNVDGGWYEAGGVSQTDSESSNGIIIGLTGTETIEDSATVVGNVVRRCYFGIKLDQTERAVIKDNDIRECRSGVFTNWAASSARPTGIDRLDNQLIGNNIECDPNAGQSGGSGGFNALLEGSWLVEGNTFTGRAAMSGGSRLLVLQGFATTNGGSADLGNFVVKNNVFKKFNLTPVEVYGSLTRCAIRAHFSGNTFDTESASPGSTVAAIRVNRPVSTQTMNITADNNTANRLLSIINWAYVSAGTESYDWGAWKHDDVITQFSIGTSSGVANATHYATHVPVDAAWGISGGIRGKTVQVDCDSGAATQTISGFFPANSMILGCTARVNTVVVLGGGGTTWSLGTSGDPFAFATGVALTAATVTSIGSQTLVPVGGPRTIGTSAENLTLTANAGTFTSGRIVVQMQYIKMLGEVQ